MTSSFDAKDSEMPCYVGADGLLFLADGQHMHRFDRVSLWGINGSSVAVLFEGLQHGVALDDVRSGDLDATIVLVESFDTDHSHALAKTLDNESSEGLLLASAVALAGVSAGELSPNNTITVELNKSRFSVNVTFDDAGAETFADCTWHVRVRQA